ncbi:MAG: Ger(x)C family spore germination protein [Deltaproteobacteria bacterium]
MKRIIVFLVIFLMLISLSGCVQLTGNNNEISDIKFIKAVGIDNGAENNIKLTAIFKAVKQREESQTGVTPKENAIVITSEAKAIAQARSDMSTYSDKILYWGQNQYILIGDEAAKQDISRYTEPFIRKIESRLDAQVLIVRGLTAEEFITKTKTSETFLTETLDHLFEAGKNLSLTKKLRIVELVQGLDNEYICPFLPCIRLKTEIGPSGTKAVGKVEIEGYAFAKNGRVIGYLDKADAIGFNWITNSFKNGILSVKDSDGEEVVLEVTYGSTKLIPKINDGAITIEINVEASSNVLEHKYRKNIYDKKSLEYLNNQQKEVITKQVLKPIYFAKENNADIFGISDLIYHKNPHYWERIKDNWYKIFPKIKFDIQIKSKINSVYIVK